MKSLVFDLDGTIADLYNVPNWLDKLRSYDESPYKDAKPIYEMNILNELLNKFKSANWKIIVVSWLSLESTKDYDSRVRKAKKEWLEKYQFPYDEIHLVKYGTTKADCVRKHGNNQILIDDNEKIRKGWHLGTTIDASKNILTELERMIA